MKKHLEGLDDAKTVFTDIADESVKRIVRALNKGADEISRTAEQLVPEDTGDLKRDIKVRRATRLRRDGKAIVAQITAGSKASTAQAAYRSEFGRSATSDHPGHRAQPFFFPAYFAKRKRVRGRIKREIARAARFKAGVRRKP